eukprot:5499185-Amphidinium_carterae.1
MDLTRHAALNGACQDVQSTGDKEPEGFSEFVERFSSSAYAGIHMIPPFANQQLNAPPGLFDPVNELPAPQTPDRRPQRSTTSPMFGLFANMLGDRGNQ